MPNEIICPLLQSRDRSCKKCYRLPEAMFMVPNTKWRPTTYINFTRNIPCFYWKIDISGFPLLKSTFSHNKKTTTFSLPTNNMKTFENQRDDCFPEWWEVAYPNVPHLRTTPLCPCPFLHSSPAPILDLLCLLSFSVLLISVAKKRALEALHGFMGCYCSPSCVGVLLVSATCFA